MPLEQCQMSVKRNSDGELKKRSCVNDKEDVTTTIMWQCVGSLDSVHSQALLGQRGGNLVGQRGELWRIRHIDTARGGHGAELLGRVFQGNNLCPMVSAGLG